MEIALWTTFLTTVITVLQTVIMWYFTKNVELAEEEEEILESATKEYVDSQLTGIKKSIVLQQDCFEAVDNDIAELLNSRRELKERMEALQELSNMLLDAVEGVGENITELQEAEAHRAENQASALDILNSAQPVDGFVYHTTPPELNPHMQQSPPHVDLPKPSIRSTRPGPPRPEPSHGRQMRVPEELLMNDEPDNLAHFDNGDEVEPLVSEDLLKPPRQEGDPMIMDLRAAPFEEHQDNYGNIHELPPSGDYEEWGSSGGRRPRNRGFRRI
jgi:hypothetical protein